MKNLTTFLTLCLVLLSNFSFSQNDVILTIKGLHSDQVIQLDSFLIENLTKNEQHFVTGIEKRESHNFNLTLGEYTGIIETNKLNTSESLQLLENKPGSLQLRYTKTTPTKVNIGIYNLGGQKLYNSQRELSMNSNIIDIKLTKNNIFLIHVSGNTFSQTFKSYGSIEKDNAIAINTYYKNVNQKSGNTTSDRFLNFNPGDQIRVTAFVKDFHSLPITKTVSNSETFNCTFIDSDTSGLYVDARDTTDYKWIKIGDQIWMAENLRFEANANCWLPENPEEARLYGRYYSWEKAETSCPDGWHLPTNEEWEHLGEFISQTEGPFDKEDDGWLQVALFLKATYGWENSCGTDDYGFAAFPGGTATNAGFFLTNYSSHWWTATESNENEAISRFMDKASNHKLGFTKTGKTIGLSVRCLKDDE